MYPWMIRMQRDRSDADLPVKLFSMEPACCGRLLLYLYRRRSAAAEMMGARNVRDQRHKLYRVFR